MEPPGGMRVSKQQQAERFPWGRQRRANGTRKNLETSEIQEPIQELCRRLHLRCERNAVGQAKGIRTNAWLRLHSKGMWDLTVYVPDAGCIVMVECKTPGAGLEPAQVEWAKVYQDCGLEMIVATSVQKFAAELDYIRRRRAEECVGGLGVIKRTEV